MASKSKILIIGGTGHLGTWITKASVALQHPTFLLVRPSTLAARPDLASSLHSIGVNILQGSLEDKSSIIDAVEHADIVISAVKMGEHIVGQLNIVEAIKQAGCNQRFVPSEFGVDVNSPRGLAASEGLQKMVFDDKRRVRQAIEAAGVPFTILCGFMFAEIFAKTLGQPVQWTSPPTDKVLIYGDGHTKGSYMCVEDIGRFIIKAADNPRTLNKVVYLRFPKNILSQLELVALWEAKYGKEIEKIHVSERDVLDMINENPFMAMKHAVYMQGATSILDQESNHVEASDLYPLEKYTSIEEYFEQFIKTS
ncbi:hypothetical protein GOP47_0007264 [Adiantum capillus-veneris]|uniref:NmrA-like domain-containing protein n=1 Tax=Adiantum capillus-veneris TaxID=13818 RepID=A0A9D4ZLR1_ADICA|nr:hypothetical protein GOP47_0007264 [Adiantum capillus-veneris]